MPRGFFPSFDDRGTLNVGAPADVAILELREGNHEFLDNYKGTRTGKQRLFPIATVLNGKRTSGARVAAMQDELAAYVVNNWAHAWAMARSGETHARECRPAALLDVGVLHPRVDFLELRHVQRESRRFGTCRRTSGRVPPQGPHWYPSQRSASQCFQHPSAPVEADECGCKTAGRWLLV